jgi:hypothetical protein
MFNTKQALFDAVATHLLAQGKQAIDEMTNICKYRAPDGSKCGIGGLIPDELYNPEMEGHMVWGGSDMGDRICETAGIPPELIDFSVVLQGAHDQGNDSNDDAWRKSWRDQMFLIAASNELNTGVFDGWRAS